jgi:hypothetical protein
MQSIVEEVNATHHWKKPFGLLIFARLQSALNPVCIFAVAFSLGAVALPGNCYRAMTFAAKST